MGGCSLKRFCGFLVDNMAILIILVSVLGAAAPSSLRWVGPHIPWMLGVVMFGMGMTLRFEDFRVLARRPWEVCIGALAQFTLMPLIAWALVKAFALPPEIAIGVVLVGTCPGGTASNVITYLAKGDVALSVAMTMTTTLLAPVVTPCLTWLLAGAWVDISLAAMMKSIAVMVLLPVAGGLLVNHFAGGLVRRFLPVLPVVSVVAIALLVGGIVALSSASLFASGPLIFAVVILHNACGLACGYAMAKLFRLSPAKARAVAVEVGMQNSGLAASLAVMYFSPLAAVPGAIFSLWHNVSGSLLANYFVKRDARRAAERLAV